MGTERLTLIFLCMFFCQSCISHEFKQADEFTLFKNYALSSCVASYYQGESIYGDALDALRGNREYANISIVAYHELNIELNNWVDIKYISKSNNESEFFKCIDFQNSPQIKKIYSRYNPCNKKGEWLDENEYEMKCNKQ